MMSRVLPAYCFSGRRLEEVGGVVVHYFSAKNVDPEGKYEMQACRDLFCDLNRERAERERYMLEDRWPDERMFASAHVLISREGEVWKLRDFDRQAYHAGHSILNKRSHCNRWTLGIELVGDMDSGFTEAQYAELAMLLVDLQQKHGFERQWIAGHDAVRHAAIEAGVAAKKKYDPSGRHDGLGDNFDWNYLSECMAVRRGAYG